MWPRRFGKDRGAFGTAEHRRKRGVVHREVLERVGAARRQGFNVVIEATIHEAPPEALEEFLSVFASAAIGWTLGVLHPPVEVAIARDVGRQGGSLGATRVAGLHSKFNGRVIPAECFLDTSAESPEATMERVLRSLADEPVDPAGASLRHPRASASDRAGAGAVLKLGTEE